MLHHQRGGADVVTANATAAGPHPRRTVGVDARRPADELAMVIGILQIELYISDAFSLKDKRRVVSSVKDRLARENRVSVAEVDALDLHQTAILGVAAVSNDVQHVQRKLDKIVEKLRSDGRFTLQDHAVEILTGH